MNGGFGSYSLDISYETLKHENYKQYGGTWLSHTYVKLMKLMIILQNINCASLTKDKM